MRKTIFSNSWLSHFELNFFSLFLHHCLRQLVYWIKNYTLPVLDRMIIPRNCLTCRLPNVPLSKRTGVMKWGLPSHWFLHKLQSCLGNWAFQNWKAVKPTSSFSFSYVSEIPTTVWCKIIRIVIMTIRIILMQFSRMQKEWEKIHPELA